MWDVGCEIKELRNCEGIRYREKDSAFALCPMLSSPDT
jgi:hypothetical protein